MLANNYVEQVSRQTYGEGGSRVPGWADHHGFSGTSGERPSDDAVGAGEPVPARVINAFGSFRVPIAGEQWACDRFRVVVEEYRLDDTNEFLAYWTEDRSFVGHGHSLQGAINSMVEFCIEKFADLQNSRRSQMTLDAQELLEHLSSVIRVVRE